MLRSMGSQRVHMTEKLNRTELYDLQSTLKHSRLLIFVFSFSRSYKARKWEMPRQNKGFTCLKATIETF